jgi:hypothetical protein
MGDALDRVVSERDALRARITELEAEVAALTPYRYLHPGIPEDRDRYRDAMETAIDSINVQLAEHGFDIQFDAATYLPK